MEIRKKCTQNECLNFVINNYDFLYAQIGAKEAANFYFGKDISNLNDKEYKTLVVMLQNPLLYNPRRFPEKPEEKLNEL